MNHLRPASVSELIMEQSQAIDQIHVLWITAGLGCDGDSIAMTAATQPSKFLNPSLRLKDPAAEQVSGSRSPTASSPVTGFYLRRESTHVWDDFSVVPTGPFF
jgi:hypothetical protein